MKHIIIQWILALVLTNWCHSVYANNIRVTRAGLTAQQYAVPESPTNFTFVFTSISWENSYRFPAESGLINWDAAWVFIKFRVGRVNPIRNNVSSLTPGSTTLSVGRADHIRPGMPLRIISGTGSLPLGVHVLWVDSTLHQVGLSAAPSVDLAGAEVEFIRVWEHAYLSNLVGSGAPTTAGHHFPKNPVLSGTTVAGGLSLEVGLMLPGQAHDGNFGGDLPRLIPQNNNFNPVMGVFMYRTTGNNSSFGHVSVDSLVLRWNYKSNMVGDNDIVEIQVHAVEMVYVPQGQFYVGAHGGTERQRFYAGSDSTRPYKVLSESSILLGSGGLNAEQWSGAGQTLPASWPKGFNAFYCMKYETSQGQYRDFLNTLSLQQQQARAATGTAAVGTAALGSGSRNNIRILTPGNTITLLPAVYDVSAPNTEHLACNFLSWEDGLAFADWCGLRPPTELEFEKAARGPVYPLPGEFAWGSTRLVAATGTSNANQAGEISTPDSANARLNNSSIGPVRVGSFARSTVVSREAAGASWWGIMELTGNIRTPVIGVGTTEGRSFDGRHGNGRLTVAGAADVAGWPITSYGGYRGGGFSDPIDRGRVADRAGMNTQATTRQADHGFVGVRSRPCNVTTDLPGPISQIPAQPDPPRVDTLCSFTASGSSGSLERFWIPGGDWELVGGQRSATVSIWVGNSPRRLRVAYFNDCGCGPERVWE
ncbi:MAG: SUMF1/EgtB/PvdO family nonheme iron enzyme [Bacteroidia bacterium]|jgi:formylglycine-generating enzyme required for sulfatase activity